MAATKTFKDYTLRWKMHYEDAWYFWTVDYSKEAIYQIVENVRLANPTIDYEVVQVFEHNGLRTYKDDK